MIPGHTLKRRSAAGVGLLALILPLVLASLACNIQTQQNDGLRQTDIALSVQQTLLAQTASALTSSGSKPTSAIQAASATPAPTATQAVVPVAEKPTEIPPSNTPPVPTPVPSNTPAAQAASLDSFPIKDWKMNFFLPINSGCKVPETGCWRMNDDYKKHFGLTELSLVSKTPLKIDPSWPRPYLVFWHRYKFENTAHIDISGDNVWSTMKILDRQKSSDSWRREAIDLAMFKGKEIVIKFGAAGIWGSGGIPGSDWFINDIQIVPNYTP
jgi:hypothetical protein